MARTFKTASLAGFGALGSNADTLRGFVNSQPELLDQIGGPQALENYIKQQQGAMFHNSEALGDYQMSPETQNIDKLLQGYQMNSVGAQGLENGRRKEVVKDGQTLYQGTPYSYNAAKDNLETVLRGGALIAGTAGLSGLVNGAGFAGAGGASQTGVPFELGNMGATGTGVPFELGSMGGGGGLLSGFQGGIPAGLKQAGGKLLDMAIANPKAAGTIAGGLLGGFGGSGGGGSSGGGAPAYSGPMPTITRGNWQPQAQAQMMQVPSFGGGLLNTQGNAGSGLWRYGK